jgi:hypothetical protein
MNPVDFIYAATSHPMLWSKYCTAVNRENRKGYGNRRGEPGEPVASASLPGYNQKGLISGSGLASESLDRKVAFRSANGNIGLSRCESDILFCCGA